MILELCGLGFIFGSGILIGRFIVPRSYKEINKERKILSQQLEIYKRNDDKLSNIIKTLKIERDNILKLEQDSNNKYKKVAFQESFSLKVSESLEEIKKYYKDSRFTRPITASITVYIWGKTYSWLTSRGFRWDGYTGSAHVKLANKLILGEAKFIVRGTADKVSREIVHYISGLSSDKTWLNQDEVQIIMSLETEFLEVKGEGIRVPVPVTEYKIERIEVPIVVEAEIKKEKAVNIPDNIEEIIASRIEVEIEAALAKKKSL